MRTADVIVVAAGRGTRVNSQLPKQFIELAGKPVIAHAIGTFDRHPRIETITVVGAEAWLPHIASEIVDKYRFRKVSRIVSGGAQRQHSVEAGLQALEASSSQVLIHDGARPFLSPALIDAVLNGLAGADGCIPAIPSANTIKEIHGEWICKTVPRDSLRLIQTPQGFQLDVLREAFTHANRTGFLATDEAALVEKYGGRVRWVPGDIDNLKITTDLDLKLARILLEKQA